jgi:predicted ATP-dependent endonuclease of OLD family
MDVEITLKNYRCFSDEKPARIVIRNGFTALVGINNSGKSTILRFFYEFRGLFKKLSNRSGNLRQAIRGIHDSFDRAVSVLDINEVFCKFNNRNLVIEIAFPKTLHDEEDRDIRDLSPDKVIVEIPRGTWHYAISSFQTSQGVHVFHENSNIDIDNGYLRENGEKKVYLVPLWEFSKKLSNSIYIGAFRNAINVGANDPYFDIYVGQAFIERWNSYKTGNSKFQNEAAYEVTENIRRIFNFKDLEINASSDKKTLQVFVDGKSYRLIELGAGLAQFILWRSQINIGQSI